VAVSRLSASDEDSVPDKRIFANLILGSLLLNSAKHRQLWLKPDEYNRHFTLIVRDIHEIFCRLEISAPNIFNGVNTVVIFKCHMCKKHRLSFLALYTSSCHLGI
jgi:hypothetical protein